MCDAIKELRQLAENPTVKGMLIGGETQGDIYCIINGNRKNLDNMEAKLGKLIEFIKAEIGDNPKLLGEVDRILNSGDDMGTKAVTLQNLRIVQENS